jgi:hypothetical protein
MSDFKYEIVERLGVLSISGTGWTKELNHISWNERDPKYDIREWAPDRSKMSKGISFTVDEIQKLKEMLDEIA